jgi:hypothetical protein
MTARSGMTDLIYRLRSLTNAGTAEAVIGTAVYWSDDQLQAQLDRARVEYSQYPLTSIPDYSGGTAYYYRFALPAANVERAESGTAAWRVTDSLGNVQGTALYSVDYDGQVMTFAANQGGTALYLNFREYNINRAAADIWRQKAGHVAAGYDIETDNHNMKRSQRHAMYLAMAKQYDTQAISSGTGSGGERRVRRVDAF